MIGKRSGPPPLRGPNPQGLKKSGMSKCPYRQSSEKNVYPGHNEKIQVKGFKFTGTK
jgi:hypothetical protein